MKKLILFFLTVFILILPGCGRKDSQIQPTQSVEVIEQQVEQASANLQQNLEIDDAQLDDISVAQVQTYDDETIVRYVQTYRGVEIYGSSMVATSADEEFFGGTYYDLTDAFGEDFDTLVKEAATVPEWMQSTESVFIDTESLHPIIYITPEQEAIICRCFFADIYLDGVTERVEVVTDISGRELYEFNLQDQKQYYSSANVQGYSGTLPVVEEDGVYYAYNEEYNFYTAYKVFETSDNVDIDDFSRSVDGKRVLVGSSDLIYSSKNDDWSQGDAKLIACAMETFYNVAAWYDYQFGYKGLDGNGGLGAVAICRVNTRSVAYNDSNILLVMEPDALLAPEIFVHEFGHSVFYKTIGASSPLQNETAALNEAVCDVFGVLYLLTTQDSGSTHDAFDMLGQEDCWILAKGLEGDDKNIPANDYTMDDYLMDRYSDHGEYVSDKFWENSANPDVWIWGIDLFLDMAAEREGISSIAIRHETSSTAERHHNSYIISHTMYRIWSDALDRDADALGQILFRTIRYLPTNADFQDFREAFLYAMRLSYPAEKVASAQGCFSNAGIEQEEEGRIVTIQKQTAGSDEITLEDMMSLPYKDLKEMVWDEFHVSSSFDTPDTWGVQCSIGKCYYTIYYYGYDFEDEDALPSQVSGQDFRKTGKKMAICDVIRTGMTYEEIAGAADVPEPVLTQAGWTTSFPMNYYFVRLFFEGDTEPGELHSAEISLDEYEGNPDTAGPDSEMNTRYMLAYCLADYGTIYADFGDSSYTNPDIYGDGSNVWNCTCMLGEGLSLVFDFASDYEDPAAMPIYARIDDFMYWSGSTTGAALCPGLSMGMTYAEAAATIGLTPLEWAPEQTWSEPVFLSYGGDAGCALELYFTGSSEETAVLVSVNAIPIG